MGKMSPVFYFLGRYFLPRPFIQGNNLTRARFRARSYQADINFRKLQNQR